VFRPHFRARTCGVEFKTDSACSLLGDKATYSSEWDGLSLAFFASTSSCLAKSSA